MNNIELELRLRTVEDEILRLEKERCDLSQQLINTYSEENFKRFESWSITNDSCVVCFSKDPSYYFCKITTIKIIDIDEEHQYMNVVTGDYLNIEDESRFSVTANRIDFSILQRLEQDFNVYVTDEATFGVLQQALCKLDIDFTNVSTYEKLVSSPTGFPLSSD